MKLNVLLDYSEEICRLHDSGMSVAELADKYNTTFYNVYQIVVETYRNDVDCLSIEDKNAILELYYKGKTNTQIAEELRIHTKAVTLVINDATYPKIKKRNFMLDEKYFDSIDTPNKAYVLGFMYADGYNNTQKILVRLQLTESDRQILEDIRREIKYEHPLYYIPPRRIYDQYTSKPQYKIDISNKYFSASLAAAGVIQNKSLILQYPNWIRDGLQSHFIRGYFDGDGSLYRGINRHSKAGYNYNVTITQTDSFCRSLKDVVEKTIGIHCSVFDASNHNGITKVFAVCGKLQTNRFLEWIYQDADLMLNRKYEKYLSEFKADLLRTNESQK